MIPRRGPSRLDIEASSALASLLLRLLTLHLGVAAADGAPFAVVGHRHAAFDANPHALDGFRRFRRKKALEKRHSTSPVRCPGSVRTGRRAAGLHGQRPIFAPFLTAPAKTRFGAKVPP